MSAVDRATAALLAATADAVDLDVAWDAVAEHVPADQVFEVITRAEEAGHVFVHRGPYRSTVISTPAGIMGALAA